MNHAIIGIEKQCTLLYQGVNGLVKTFLREALGIYVTFSLLFVKSF